MKNFGGIGVLLEFDSVVVLSLMLVLFSGVAMSYNLAWWWAPLMTVILMLGFALTGMVYATGRFMMTDILITWLPISLGLAVIATIIRIYIDGKSKRLIQWLTVVSIIVISSTGLYTYLQGITTMDEAFLDELSEEDITSMTIKTSFSPGDVNVTELEEEDEIEDILDTLSEVELRRYYQPVVQSNITLELMSDQKQNQLVFYLGEPLVKIDRYIYKMDSDEIVDLLRDKRDLTT
ncbi:hypothetical protein ACKXGF_05570 [Alkalibacillus sp. S2W]|uniref:hypothetical protein n=1 Tax=Alkalibacillus sp. S2W TaxID=3386553 RepID=UPI00398D10F2